MNKNKNYEMILGLVSPIGVDLDTVIENIKSSVQEYKYKTVIINVANLPSILLRKLNNIKSRNAIDNLSSEMPELRRVADKHLKTDGFDVFVAMIACYIKQIREEQSENTNIIYILDNLKHPQDVLSLQQIYKKSYYTIGVTASVNQRISLKYSKNIRGDESTELDDAGISKAAYEIYEDYDLVPNNGTKNIWANSTSKAYQLSDFFINLSEESAKNSKLKPNIERFIDLICGAPVITPTPREHSMFLAYMYSLRSADLSRQVGSVITSLDHDVLALGANETPQAGGGQYWADDDYVAHTIDNQIHIKNNKNDQRDYTLGHDANAKLKNGIFNEIISNLINDGIVEETDQIQSEVMQALKNTSLNDITEFGRVVHAEMSSILSAARNGISVKNTNMYCTTYPCHNCAKHIVASGIEKVEYIEPYPKSKANRLHKDSIYDPDALIENEEVIKIMVEEYKEYLLNMHTKCLVSARKVFFKQYSGVGPNRYLDLFSMKLGEARIIKRKTDSDAILLNRKNINIPRVPVLSEQNIFNESLFFEAIDLNIENNMLKNILDEFEKANGLSPESRLESIIKYWEPNYKYGYITTVKAGKDYLFNIDNLYDGRVNNVKVGKKVSFKLKPGNEGIYFATEIKFIECENKIINSTIKNWDPLIGKGFICSDYGNDYIFFKDKIDEKDHDMICEGASVTFKIRESNKGGYYAIDIRVSGGI